MAQADGGVRAGERERRVVVIERRIQPICCAVAKRAIYGERRLHVVGTGCPVIVLNVASAASCGRVGKDTARVTLIAGHCSWAPVSGNGVLLWLKILVVQFVVVWHGVVGKTGLCVVGIIRALVIGQVTSDASSRRADKLVVFVTGIANDSGVSAREGERGRVVIEGGVEPSRIVVADRALRRIKTGRAGVGRIVRVLVIRHMAALASLRNTGKSAVGMASGAGQSRVRAHEGEPGLSAVIEFRVQPAIHAMAGRTAASREDSRELFVGRVLGAGKILRVTSDALGTQALILGVGCPWMASFASDARVRTEQRKAIRMLTRA